MAVVFDPHECRNRAFRYGLLARNSYSDAAHQKFSELAKTWLMLALRLEGHWRLTDERPLGTGLSFSEALAEPLRLCEPRLPCFLARRSDHEPRLGSGGNLSG
jgi:hypothetical protein